MVTPDTMPIYNQEAEEALIGSILISEDTLLEISDLMISGSSFFIERLGWIFEAANELHHRQTRVDMVTLSDLLQQQGRLDEIGGQPYLTQLLNVTPTHTHARHYAEIVKRDAVKRLAVDLAAKITRSAKDDEDAREVVSKVEAGAMALLKALGSDAGAFVSDIAAAALEMLEQRTQAGGVVGLPTGLTDLDKLLGGLKRGKLYTFAAPTGQGKSTLALQAAWNAVKTKSARVLFFSLEMDRIELFNRLWAAESGVAGQAIENGKIPKEKWPDLLQAMQLVTHHGKSLKIVDDPALTLEKLRQEAIAEWARNGLDLIVVDYLQLLRTLKKAETRQLEVAAISRSIKILAGELSVPVISISQLNRSSEARSDKRPKLSDLRESGAIEQDSDVVVFLYDPDTDEFPNLVEVIVDKHRGGQTGATSLFFKKATYRFENVVTKIQSLE